MDYQELLKEENRQRQEEENRQRQEDAQKKLEDHAKKLAVARDSNRKSELIARQQLRKAFLSGDRNAIQRAVEIFGACLDVGLALNQMAKEISQGIQDLLSHEGARQPASRYIAYLEGVNKVIAGGQLIAAAYEEIAGRPPPTEMDELSSKLEKVSTLFSVGTTLLGLALHISLYGFYLAEMCENIGVLMERLRDITHDNNDQARQLDLGRWGAEPGGQAMYEYMNRVFSGSAGLPTDKVADYFFDHRVQFKAATGSDVPIQGVPGFRTLDPLNFPEWIQENRDIVWTSLYGDWKLPKAGRRKK